MFRIKVQEKTKKNFDILRRSIKKTKKKLADNKVQQHKIFINICQIIKKNKNMYFE